MHSESGPNKTPHTFQLPVPFQQCSVGLVGLTEVVLRLDASTFHRSSDASALADALKGDTGDCIGTSVEDSGLVPVPKREGRTA